MFPNNDSHKPPPMFNIYLTLKCTWGVCSLFCICLNKLPPYFLAYLNSQIGSGGEGKLCDRRIYHLPSHAGAPSLGWRLLSGYFKAVALLNSFRNQGARLSEM